MFQQVQENCIDLVGRIADRGAEYVPAREWMRICFELLDMLKAHKKAIRRAAVNTFGYIAKAIGPQDVLVTLLNNLKVRVLKQGRGCTLWLWRGWQTYCSAACCGCHDNPLSR